MHKVADILKFAIQNEMRAKVFYSQAAEITTEGESQMVFLELAEMEDGHARLLVNRFGKLLMEQGYDAEANLQEIEADTEKALTVEDTDLIKKGEMRGVIEFAIGLEAQARDNYRELANRFSEAEDKTFCEDLAAEEQKHFDDLSKLRVSVDTPIDERPAL